MSHVEGVFLTLALEIGLAQTIAETLKDIDGAIASLPDTVGAATYRQRLEGQRASLRNPTLRTSAALVASMCARDPSLTPRIRSAFADLAARHADLAVFYGQLPAAAQDLQRAS
ncbi:hypothetical protein [Caulobacter endophyticus]|uniref:Uncharacterized protein n=1 Tax=Caulobacter endophyticus TaxID=2172652 RepID=A0A2T9JI87_9CAUL|nr:hypothetical protein [Caulobacter endophyticus]PVM83402.1 hypothetical protein DDF67_20920 [Caulobacter endophyticus]